MHDLNDLFYFVQVVDHGGFAPAGRALGMPKSKLSRRIAMLEERLEARLVMRSTRRFSVTELGQAYYAHCKAMLVEADAAEEVIALTRSEPRGIVRLACPLALLDARIAQMLSAFMLANPRIEVHLQAMDRRVDVIAEGVDIAIRVRPSPLEDSDLALRILGERAQLLVASPQLLKESGTPLVPADLAKLPTLGMGVPQSDHLWNLYGPDGAYVTLHHHPRLITRGMLALRCAAMAGVGVVQLPTMMVQEQLKQGTLVQVLPGWAPGREIIHAVFASRRGLLPSVRALIDFLVESFRSIDEE